MTAMIPYNRLAKLGAQIGVIWLRSGAKKLGITVWLLAVSGILIGASAAEYGIITKNTVTLYARPDKTSLPVAQLNEQDEVEVLKQQGDWYYVRYKNQIGFILQSEDVLHVIGSGIDRDKSVDPKQRKKIKRLEDRADQLQQKIKTSESQLKAYTDKEVAILTNLNDIDYSMDRVRRKVYANRRELSAIEKKIASATATHQQLTREIKANEAYATQRLVALYKLSWFDKMQFLASAETFFEFIQRKRNLERIWKHDEVIRNRLVNDKSEQKALLIELNSQRNQKAALQAAIGREMRTLAIKRRQRTKILNDIRTKRTLEKAALDSLKNAADELNEKIGTLNATAKEPAIEVSLAPFSDLKGLLKMPVKGNIINRYGRHYDAEFDITHFRSGIDIQAKRGAKIQAVYAGRIIFASWFKGYGNMMIIDHGDNYYTVYAHLEDVYRKTGDFVNTGEDIATVGDTGSMVGPILHFEVRHHGKPINPLQWIVKG